MKKIILFFIIIFISFLPLLGLAKNKVEYKRQQLLHKKIEKILAEFGENLNIGILVQNISTGKTLYKKNSDRYFVPASNEKLFTAFAALRYLGPDFIYQTNLYADTTKIKNGALNDNVYLQFTGDPTLTLEQIDRLISSLALAGINKINGNIIVDDTAFDQVPMSPGTAWDDNKFCFGAPISAIIINHNCINATISPAAKPDQPAILTLPSQPQFIYLNNRVLTHQLTESECTLELELTNEAVYTISGCMKTTELPKKLSMAISNPRVYIQSTLGYLLRKNNITYNRHIEFQKLTAQSKLIASESSPRLKDLVKIMLKESDNTIANSLFKILGLLYSKQIGNWQNGKNALYDILNKTIQLDASKITLIDGAGASRYNYVTPQQIVMLLHKIYLSGDASVFFSALPISGIDGTLKNRMNSPELLGKIHAKTGTETAVTSLSGYIETRKKQTLAFSILINGFVDSPLKYKELEDKICASLIEAG
jgi:serine-type D-Ala-D-Ala carboxypeptidase/endopeptidase (penicillin-binding protein 4)